MIFSSNKTERFFLRGMQRSVTRFFALKTGNKNNIIYRTIVDDNNNNSNNNNNSKIHNNNSKNYSKINSNNYSNNLSNNSTNKQLYDNRKTDKPATMRLMEEIKELDRTSRWNPTFMMLLLDTRKMVEDLTQTAARLPQNRGLNRYRDVLPYDTSRVKLTTSPHGDYINASYVEVPSAKRRYILAQGPLPGTSEHFWRMIWENNSKGIVMLNKIVEKNVIKCHPYWPMGEEEELEFGDFVISNYSCQMRTSFIIRELLLRHTPTEEQRIIKQFHFVMWPDFGVPLEPSCFLEFLDEIKTSSILDDAETPAVVHCSAGIGRSGTFCLVDSVLELAHEADVVVDDIDPHSMLLAMRKHRCGLIQTAEQLRFADIAIVYGFHAIHPHLAGDDDDDEGGEENGVESGESLSESENGSSADAIPPPLPPRQKKDTGPAKPARGVGSAEALEEELKDQEKAYQRFSRLDPSSEGSSEEEILDLSGEETSEDENEEDLDSSSVATPGLESGTAVDTIVDESNRVDDFSDKDSDSVTTPSSKPSSDTSPTNLNENNIESTISQVKESETELRRRQLQEKKEKAKKLVENIKKNMKDNEKDAESYLPKNFWTYTGVALGVGSLFLLAYHLYTL